MHWKNLSFQQFYVENCHLALKTQSFAFALSEKYVGNEHETETEEKGIRCPSFLAVGVSFGDHLVADNVQHGTSRKGESEGKDRLRDADCEKADEGTDHLNNTRCRGDDKRSFG